MSEDDSTDRLLEKAGQRLAARRRVPESTYRLQFHKEFTFRDATAIVPYLHQLGISDCYASPYLKARPGSKHGYDITDHRVLNPEIGSEEDYQAFVAALCDAGMGQLLDTVPNHMGISGNENPWWNDVLENGPSSAYAGYFDIDWRPVKPQLRDKVLLPVLGAPYGEVLESRQLQLRYEAGAFVVAYFEHRFPIAPDSYVRILGLRSEELGQTLGADSADFMEYGSILTAAGHLPRRSDTDPARIAERQRDKEVLKRRLAALADKSAAVRQCIEASVQQLNGVAGDPRSFDALDELLNEQSYRLSFWRVASDEINYRRFFDVNELAALSMEKREVFEATHALVLRLVQEGKVTGLRIDHPDGLYDPRQYLAWLQEQAILNAAKAIFESESRTTDQAGAPEWKDLAAALSARIRDRFADAAETAWRQPLYVVVEKILGRDEPLPEDWPVQGTTGYDVLNLINGVFVRGRSEAEFSRLYRRFSRMDTAFGDLVYQKKFLIMQVSLSSELHMLATQLDRLSEKNRGSRDFTLNSLRHALREIIACFPVYRSYISSAGIHPRDHLYVQTAAVRARRKNPAISASIFDFVRDMLLLRYPAGSASPEEQLRFAGKFQQVTSPVMAKGLEDTAFYDYNRLVSLNEVGGDPGAFGVSLEEFHRRNQERQRLWPRTLIPLSTHDTKRSEDVRARINVLSEIPQEWRKHLLTWAKLNRKHREQLEGLDAPDRNDEYLLYQTLIGAWPLPPHDDDQHPAFVRRIQEYMAKATHEAKIHTSWINPNLAYDEAVARFVGRILDPRLSERFLADFTEFQRRVSHCGLFNSLAQTLLKFAAPGVADTYQGTELWDFSLVDPDNRRPVDYELRRNMLADLRGRLANPQTDLVALARELTERKEDGRIKLFVTHRLLELRRALSGLFSAGEYLPVTAAGRRADHLVAFLRQYEGRWALSIAPRLIAGLLPEPYGLPLGREVWQETALALPGMAANQRCRNVFTGEVFGVAEVGGHFCIPAAPALGNFPIALLVGEG
jgi:(1->4)-alpha-D-glucan 1-alpha-D-glucosylmutase